MNHHSLLCTMILLISTTAHALQERSRTHAQFVDIPVENSFESINIPLEVIKRFPVVYSLFEEDTGITSFSLKNFKDVYASYFKKIVQLLIELVQLDQQAIIKTLQTTELTTQELITLIQLSNYLNAQDKDGNSIVKTIVSNFIQLICDKQDCITQLLDHAEENIFGIEATEVKKFLLQESTLHIKKEIPLDLPKQLQNKRVEVQEFHWSPDGTSFVVTLMISQGKGEGKAVTYQYQQHGHTFQVSQQWTGYHNPYQDIKKNNAQAQRKKIFKATKNSKTQSTDIWQHDTHLQTINVYPVFINWSEDGTLALTSLNEISFYELDHDRFKKTAQYPLDASEYQDIVWNPQQLTLALVHRNQLPTIIYYLQDPLQLSINQIIILLLNENPICKKQVHQNKALFIKAAETYPQNFKTLLMQTLPAASKKPLQK